MKFANPNLFILLWIIPILLFLYIKSFSKKSKLLNSFGDKKVLYKFLNLKSIKKNTYYRATFIILSIFFIIIALELYSHSRFKFVSQRAPQTQPPMGGTVSIIREPCTATSPAPHQSAPDLPRKAGGTSIVTV